MQKQKQASSFKPQADSRSKSWEPGTEKTEPFESRKEAEK